MIKEVWKFRFKSIIINLQRKFESSVHESGQTMKTVPLLCFTLLFLLDISCGLVLPEDHPAKGLSIDDEVVATEDGCKCTGDSCSCCKTVTLKFLSLTKQVCVNLLFDQRGLGFDLQLTIDGLVVLHQKVTAKNPPPVCVKIPFPGQQVKACIEFTNLKVSSSGVSGCLDLSVTVTQEYKFQIGCFKIPPTDHSLSELLSDTGVVTTTGVGCQCTANSCKCCKTVSMKGISKTVCINLVYQALEIDLKLMVDGQVYINQKFQVKSPPPDMCADITVYGRTVKVCAQLTNFKFDGKGVSGCVGATATFQGKEHKIEIGCFKMSSAQYRIFKSTYVFESEIDYAK